jgi:hypothetical protein
MELSYDISNISSYIRIVSKDLKNNVNLPYKIQALLIEMDTHEENNMFILQDSGS